MRLKALILAALGLTISTAAEAVPLRFELNSTCLSDCNAIGLNNGDAVGGFIVLDSTTFNNGYNSASVLDFEMTFGTISVDFDSALFFRFRGVSPASVDELIRWSLSASEAISPDRDEGFGIHGGDIPFTTLFADDQTGCNNANCNVIFNSGGATFANFGTITGVAQIPLPATAWLLLGGLAALGVRGRRARA
ncbi:MAG: VPLPA-CTERM sorting domain-containing protein [Pseudomonadota bacterium]